MSSTAKPPLLALPSRISRYEVRASIVTWAAIHTGRGVLNPLAVSDHNCKTDEIADSEANEIISSVSP